jgi:hypothetical protein
MNVWSTKKLQLFKLFSSYSYLKPSLQTGRQIYPNKRNGGPEQIKQ